MNLAAPLLCTLDFETYFDSKFSLRSKHYNTSEYIRDPLFHVNCVAIKLDDQPTKVYPGSQVKKALKAINWKKTALLCHNTAFDGLILTHHYGIKPAYYYDTMSMTRGLHNEQSRAGLDKIAKFYGLEGKLEGGAALEKSKGLTKLEKEYPEILEELMMYCAQDNELTYQVFTKQIEVYPQNELDLINLTIRMFTEPVLLCDQDKLRLAHAHEVIERVAAVQRSGYNEASLNSDMKFANILRSLGVNIPRKISFRTGLEANALSINDEAFKDLEYHDDIRVVRAIQGRMAVKSRLNETRAERMIKATANGMSLPVHLNYFGAKTGRWSGGNKTNLQNLPRIEWTPTKPPKPVPQTGELRQSIIAPEGQVIVVADSAQIEARTLAWLAGQQDIVDAFARKEDVYCKMASTIYGREITKADKTERFVGKVAVLGLGYGMGGAKFQTTLALGNMGPPVDIELREATKIVNTYRKNNAAIKRYWGVCEQMLKNLILGVDKEYGCVSLEDNSIWLPNGMALHYPVMKAEYDSNRERLTGYTYQANDARKKIYGGLLSENIVQALARIIVGEQMLAVARKLPEEGRVVLMTHDEIVCTVPEAQAESTLKMMINEMRKPPAWGEGIPLDAEGGFAKNYVK